jgi:hypothetical protein
MIFVDQRWQEVKLGCVFGAESRVDDARRPSLAARLWPRAVAVGAGER